MLPTVLAVTLLAQKSAGSLKPYQLSPGFSIRLPSAPKPAGRSAQVKYWQVILPGKGAYVIGSFPIDQKTISPDRVLANMVSGYLQGAKGELMAQQDIVWQGWPALEFQMKAPKGVMCRVRNYVTPAGGFQVASLSLTSAELPQTKGVLNSVKLPGATGPETSAGPRFQVFTFPGTAFTFPLPAKPKVESIPLANNPYGLVMHRALAIYGNRTYLAAYADIPKEATPELAPDRIKGTLGGLSEEFIQSLHGQNVRDHWTTAGGKPVLTSEFVSQDGGAYGKIEAAFAKDRYYMLMALVPKPLKASSEVVRYFESFGLMMK